MHQISYYIYYIMLTCKFHVLFIKNPWISKIAWCTLTDQNSFLSRVLSSSLAKMDSSWPFCNCHKETIEHLFLHFHFARVVWFGYSLTLRPDSLNTSSISLWLLHWLGANDVPFQESRSFFILVYCTLFII